MGGYKCITLVVPCMFWEPNKWYVQATSELRGVPVWVCFVLFLEQVLEMLAVELSLRSWTFWFFSNKSKGFQVEHADFKCSKFFLIFIWGTMIDNAEYGMVSFPHHAPECQLPFTMSQCWPHPHPNPHPSYSDLLFLRPVVRFCCLWLYLISHYFI